MRILVALVAVFVVVGAATVAFAPDEPSGSEEFGRQFVDACTRSGVDDDPCRCALGRWQAEVPEPGLTELDDDLADGDDLPEALRRALEACIPAD
jgi:hypothetical protein